MKNKQRDIFDDVFGPLPAWAEWIAVVLFVFLCVTIFI